MIGGASRGRGRGIATVFVERAPSPVDENVGERHPRTGELRTVGTGGAETRSDDPREGKN